MSHIFCHNRLAYEAMKSFSPAATHNNHRCLTCEFNDQNVAGDFRAERRDEIALERTGKLLLTAHVQYRMDQRGITVSEVRLALQEFVKELHRQRSMQSPQARLWEDSMSWGDEIKWTSRIGLTIVFTASRDTVTLITAYWKGLSDPRPKDEEDCGIFPSPKSAAGMGDCYEANGKFFMNSVTPFLGGSSKSMRLVHGEVTGQGSLDGVNYGHAWVEDGNTVIDKSNGKNLRMPKAAYYALGNIDQNDNLHKYTPEEFRRKVLKHEHWGPWDLRTSTGL